MILKLTLTIFILLNLIACGGGGGGSSDANPGVEPDNNACDLIGANRSFRIINGTSCSGNTGIVRVILTYPSLVVAQCSGTLIGNKHVLTAAHCFSPQPRSSKIIIGNDQGQEIGVSNVAIPAQYNRDSGSNDYDLAILTLNQDAGRGTIPLLFGRAAFPGEIVGIYGYGSTNGSNISTTLNSGEMKISSVNDQEIRAKFDGTGSNTCIGDSGGPLLGIHNNQVGIMGITSNGTRQDCQAGDISGFTNLQNQEIIDFISDIVPDLNLL